ncbi:hypothetical protein [Pseudomonas abietaniphila]|uniref:ABC-2 type transport system permease protein n=1 Tax=Pseudomonas abietaniphila TaxID=89065 RepID=A0A1G7VTN2_9PSED|nr:hypothetical protein [Pseudomonas abietaniphila]SDG62260.1 ABC-2 type transport system permease protein [Pseudomonas abietaniphila]
MQSTTVKVFELSIILIKEQLKEPIAFIWILLSPSLMFYFIFLTKGLNEKPTIDYLDHSAYYYSYVASSVAFFGFAFYLVGRRESGFIRSFAYSLKARGILLTAQLLSYSIISLTYCTFLYLLTRPLFGEYQLLEFTALLLRFYICFLMFCCGGLLLSQLRLSFQNANTLFSALLFMMLMMLIAARVTTSTIIRFINDINPMTLGSSIMLMNDLQLARASLIIGALLLSITFMTIKLMPINPVWSRY